MTNHNVENLNMNSSLTEAQIEYLKEVNEEYILGFQEMNKIDHKTKTLTVYGSARMDESDRDYQDIEKISHHLRTHNWSVVTGGGPGIMTAALAGDHARPLDTIAYNINIKNEEEKSNADISVSFDHFPVRKYLLRQSDAFLVAPGGYGTMDELMELLTLIQTDKKIKTPVVLYNKKFWAGLIEWFEETLLQRGTIDKGSLNLFVVADTPEEVVDFLYSHC